MAADVGGKMVRFVVCRKGERHVVAARDDDMLVLQRVAPQIGLAGMVNVVIGHAAPANVEPLTGIATKLGEAVRNNSGSTGCPSSARIYAEATGKPDSWVEITANERHPGGNVFAGRGGGRCPRFDTRQNLSIPRRVNGQLYGSFLPGTPENLQRALTGLMEFLPSGGWFDHKDAVDPLETDASYPA